MRNWPERVLDILEAIERIERYASSGRERFESDELVQTWVVHNLEIIGEAAAKLGDDFHVRHQSVPWPQIVAMRNILIHEYFGIDFAEVWQVVVRDLPPLKAYLQTLLVEERTLE